MLISEIDDTRILFEDGPRLILDGDGPAVFMPGWRALLAYTGLAPVTIVPFESAQGGVGIWFLDENMRRRGGALEELPAQMLADLVAAVCALLDGIWQALMLSRRPEAMTEAQLAFFFLPEHCRMLLLGLYLGSFDARPDCRGLDQAGRGAFGVPVLDCSTRRVPLVGGELHWLSDAGLLQRLFDRLPAGNGLLFRSPCDGSVVSCGKSILLDTDLVAYKLHDETWDLSVFLVAGDIFNRTLALYFPEANLVLSHEPERFRASCPDLAGRFHAHIARHGLALFRYLASDRVEPVHFWRGRNAIHLGHVLWNDYSGIDRMLSADPASAPRMLVCESGSGPEMYGPLDQVFPALQGRVRREQEPLMALAGSLYDEDALLFRTSAMFVSRALRERILRPVPAKGADAPILLLGLRTENRTATDLHGFCVALVAHLAAGPGPVTLVVDGHNSRTDGGTIWSHGELEVADSPIDTERSLVRLMRDAAAGTQVAVVDVIGAPVADSLGWARAARGFVGFWGAGLAKYRWVCNLPGLVITSRWNLENLHDLHIYSSPQFMQEPAPLAFVSPDAVHDRPDAPVMIRHGDTPAPSLWNFALDLPAVLSGMDEALGSLLFPPVAAALTARPVRKRNVRSEAAARSVPAASRDNSSTPSTQT